MAALRGEAKSAIDAFFEAAQQAESVAADPGIREYPQRARAAHQLWGRHKQLTLISSKELTEVADDLANKPGSLLWQEGPVEKPVYEQVGKEVRVFREAAKREVIWNES
jgi:hypothetical protein